MKQSYKKALSIMVAFLILIQTIVPSLAIADGNENKTKEDNTAGITDVFKENLVKSEESEERENDSTESTLPYADKDAENPKISEKEEDVIKKTETNGTTFSSGVTVTAKKVWVGGSTPRPTVKFELWRERWGLAELIKHGEEKVPDKDGGGIIELPNGTTSATWTGLPDKSLIYKYKYFIKEVSVLEDYTASYSKDRLTVTNTYNSPKVDVTVNLNWDTSHAKDNHDTTKPKVEVQLYQNGIPYEKPVSLNGTTRAADLSHTWKGLDKTDKDGKEYDYHVRKVLNPLSFFVPTYEDDGLTTTITNTFYNLDNLDAPTTGTPETVFKTEGETGTEIWKLENSKNTRAGGTLQPGEVQVDKKATPVPGMVNTWDIELEIKGKVEQKTSDIVLVIDRSGSMSGNRMTNAKAAAKNFINTLLDETGATYNRIAIVSFAGDVTTNQVLTNNKTALIAAIDGLIANGGTHTQAGLDRGEAELATSTAAYKNIVLLSDGQPTYSYQITNQAWRTYYVDASGTRIRHTSTTVPEGNFNTTRVGGGNSLTTFIETYPTTGSNNQKYDYYYNHGNSAIAEAGFIKGRNKIIYTIAFDAGTTGTPILNSIASPGKSYTASENDLELVFEQIAGSLKAPMKNAVVTDPMGPGFVQVGTITKSQGQATYDSASKTINWNVGDLSKPENSDIKTATLKYRVEITDDILTATPAEGTTSENKLYYTNGDAKVDYKDGSNTDQTKNFPKPKVNPIFLKVEKKLEGEDASAEKEFTINIKGPTGSNYDTNVTLKGGQSKVLTNLRYAGNYTVTEPGETDYDITINPETFTVTAPSGNPLVDSGQADIDVLVTNKFKTPRIDKNIVEGTTRTKVTNAAMGDTVNYELKTKVPDTSGYSNYVFKVTDTMDNGLTYKYTPTLEDGVTVKIDGVNYTDFTVTQSGQIITIDFPNMAAQQANKGKEMVITYSATLNTNASIGTANKNSVKLTYSAKNGTKDTEPVITETYTTSLDITKVIKGTNTPLAGAKFRITGDNLNQVIVVGKNGTSTVTVSPTSHAEDFVVDATGKIVFKGLKAGTYTITEIESPSGYNPIAPFNITISFNSTDKKFTLKQGENTIGEPGGTLSMTVDNESGTLFPETGGTGTKMLYAVGVALVLGSGIALAIKAKRNKFAEK